MQSQWKLQHPSADTSEPSLEEVPLEERETLPPPTVPEPSASEVRLKVRFRIAGAVVDVVVADLTRDPRSESYEPVTFDGRPIRRARTLALVPPPRQSSVSSVQSPAIKKLKTEG
jgi:hypothetical protein